MFECFVCDGWFPSEKSLSKHHWDVHGLSDGYEDSNRTNDTEQNSLDLSLEPEEISSESKIIEVPNTNNEVIDVPSEDIQNELDIENDPKPTIPLRPRRSGSRTKSYQEDNIEVGNVDESSTFNCHLCSNRFGKGSNLVKHLLVEHLLVKYICQICQKDLRNAKALSLHYKLEHPGQNVDFRCHICIGAKTYSRRDNLEEHYLRFHLRIPHHCGNCGKSFRSLGSLWMHESEMRCPKIVTKELPKQASASKTSTPVNDEIEVVEPAVLKKNRKLIVMVKRCPFTSALALKRKHLANQIHDQPKSKRHKKIEKQVHEVESQAEPSDVIKRPKQAVTMKPFKDHLTDHEDFEVDDSNDQDNHDQLSKKSKRSRRSSTLKTTSIDQDHDSKRRVQKPTDLKNHLIQNAYEKHFGRPKEVSANPKGSEDQIDPIKTPRRSSSLKETKADGKLVTSLLDLKYLPWSAAGLINFNFTYEDHNEVQVLDSQRRVQRPIDIKNGQVLDDHEQPSKRPRRSSTLKDTDQVIENQDEAKQTKVTPDDKVFDLKDVLCDICDEEVDKSSLSDHYLNIHLNLMLSEHDKICRICDRIFQNNDKLLGHLLTEHLRLKLVCDLCGLIASAPYDLILHKLNIHEEKSKQENEITTESHSVSETDQNSLEGTDQETNNVATESKVNQVSEEIKVVKDLTEVAKKITEVVHEVTKVTEEVTEDAHEVTEVIKEVTDEVPDEGVQNGSKVDNDHTRVEDYLNNCSKVFKKAFNTMKQYQDKKEPNEADETNDFQFLICKLCPRTFDKLEELNNHYLSFHLSMTFPCDNCGSDADYGNFQYLNLHKKIMHEEMIEPESSSCHLCSITFGSYETLTEHLLSFHLEINNVPQVRKEFENEMDTSKKVKEATEIKVEPNQQDNLEENFQSCIENSIEHIDNDPAEVDVQEGPEKALDKQSFDIKVIKPNLDLTKEIKDPEEEKENIGKTLKGIKLKASRKATVKVIRLLKFSPKKDDKYSCKFCSISHESYWKLCHHLTKVHGKCDYCSRSFNKAMSLYCHQKKDCIVKNNYKWVEKR